MAENNKRNSKHAFNIEKHCERHFNLEKEETAVGNIVTSPIVNRSEQQQSEGNHAVHSGGNGGRKKLLIAIVSIAAVLVLAFFGYKCCGNSATDSKPLAPTETDTNQVDTTVQQQDTVHVEDTNFQSVQETNVEDSNSTSTESALPQESNASVKDMALQVWKGVYGNGTERKQKLGSNYEAVQRYVNEMYRNGYRN